MKKLFAFILSISFIFGAMTVTANAADSLDAPHIDFIFEEGTLVEIQERIIADLTGEDDGVETCNILCDLLGHKLETGVTTSITHNASSTNPRCLEKKHQYEICSRCDYSKYTLISSKYISCC
ncbi:MAG: hypothetical protein E7516_02870 [Ruminococcaceae bacterium]|nr:hypothetical protein [Oscillospiraceae bacterium]